MTRRDEGRHSDASSDVADTKRFGPPGVTERPAFDSSCEPLSGDQSLASPRAKIDAT